MGDTAIVVGADGSEVSDAVVRQSAVLAAALGASLHIVAPGAALERAARSALDCDVRIESHKAVHDLRATLWEVARQTDAELIVIERPPRGRIRGALRALRRRVFPDVYTPVDVIDARAAREQARQN
jgi:hypothetical protein